MMKAINSLRVDIRLRNNRLVQRREELGMTSADFCRAGAFKPSEYSALETMRESPLTARGEWRAIATALAHFHGVTEDDLFPADVLTVRKTLGSIRLDGHQLKALMQATPDPALTLEERQSLGNLGEHLGRLRPIEERVVKMRFGLEHDAKTLAEVGAEFGLTGCRIQQIEKRALRELRFAMDKERAIEERRTM